MTFRFLRLLAWQLLLTLACALPQAARASEETVEITRAYIEAAEEGYRLSAAYTFDLSHALEDALQSGISLDFTTEISFTRRRWYWFPEKAWAAKRTHRIWYDVLTRQYHVKVLGTVQQPFGTLEDALFFIRRPTRWVVAPRGALKVGETYDVTLSMGLDNLPKPFQVNALNNRQWTLSSQRKTFQYKAE
ncbi:DUF4390 domain-containing protein [Massilia endophytica]|uniref:DUF4390 domain-containing protein n=1 Tax=Massilia endophytica TaxID=2899220 RepID=UPI001E50AFCA|nr:DUF4390 domain-containing protein [Massilia endophytica]UGQ47027.1 DUF4390 domain-containing protein [Massilia endophytica]